MRNLLLAVVSILLCALVAEVAVRLIPRPEPQNFTVVPRDITAPPRHDGVTFSMKPNATVTQEFGSDPRGYFNEGATLTYRTNSLSFRGPETTVEKPPGTFRIVGAGDSFTFGTGVREEDTFLQVLERRLNAERSDRRYEVLNLGAMGYDTRNEAFRLIAEGRPLEPDIAVICYVLNDTGVKGGFSEQPAELPWYRRLSRLMDFVMTRIERKRATQELIAAYLAGHEDGHEGWEESKGAFVWANRTGENYGYRVVVMIFPILYRLSGDYPFTPIHEKLRQHLDEYGIPVLDLLPAFAGYDGPELWVHPNNEHPNEVAHRIAGEALYEFLKNEGLLDYQ